MKIIYYAHSVSIYGTKQEKRDLETLRNLGFEIINPNSTIHSKYYEELKARTGNGMPYFDMLISSCDSLAFRAHPDGTIPAGVAKEIETACNSDLPVFELPSSIRRRTMSLEETREYLKELGVR